MLLAIFDKVKDKMKDKLPLQKEMGELWSLNSKRNMRTKGQFLGRGSVFLLLICQVATGGEAQQQTNDTKTVVMDLWFTDGQCEATFTSGALFSPFGPTKGRPTINYTISELQLGYMLTDPHGPGWLRGNVELAGEGFGGAVFLGSSGSYVAGGTLWLRYNFLRTKAYGLCPFFQGGGGFTFTDIDRGVVGQRFNFNLDLGAGARYFLSQRCSLNLEYRYQHISNANLGPHNLGINSHGPILGFSYFF